MHFCIHAADFPQLLVLSGDCYRAFLLSKEAFKQHDLTDTDDKQQDSLSKGPVGDALQKVLRFCAVVCFSKSVPRLRVSHHLQDLMNGDTRGFQLKKTKTKRNKPKAKLTMQCVTHKKHSNKFSFSEPW